MIKERKMRKNEPSQRSDGRRRVLSAILWGGSAVVTLPESWTRPVIQSVLLPAHAQTSAPDEEPDSEDGTFSCTNTYEGQISLASETCGVGATVSITLGPAPGRALNASLGAAPYTGAGTYNMDGSFGPIALVSGSVNFVIEGNITSDCSQITGRTIADESTACGSAPNDGNFALIPV